MTLCGSNQTLGTREIEISAIYTKILYFCNIFFSYYGLNECSHCVLYYSNIMCIIAKYTCVMLNFTLLCNETTFSIILTIIHVCVWVGGWLIFLIIMVDGRLVDITKSQIQSNKYLYRGFQPRFGHHIYRNLWSTLNISH